MKANSSPEPAPRPVTATGSVAPSPNTIRTVPISVYKELAAELQASRAMLDSLNAQNQQLLQQNQRFRQEIERLVQVCGSLQQVAGLPQPTWVTPTQAPPSRTPSTPPNPQAVRSTPPEVAPFVPHPPESPQPLFTEQTEIQPQPTAQASAAREMGGFWLWVTMFVIIITAFGAGFLVMRPLLPNNSR